MPQKHINIKVDPEWWATLSAHALSQGKFPSTFLKEAADHALVKAGVLREPSPPAVLWRFRPSHPK